MHFYEGNTKAYAYVCFVGMTSKQKEEIVAFMEKVPIARLDWPGESAYNAVVSLRKRGYAEILPATYPFIVEVGLVNTIVKSHMTEAMKSTPHPVSCSFVPDQSMSAGLNRKITSEDDWKRLFEDFLSHCDAASVQHAFQTGDNKDGYWGFGAPMSFDLSKLFLKVVTVGVGEQFTHDCGQKGGIGRVLNNLFNTVEQ